MNDRQYERRVRRQLDRALEATAASAARAENAVSEWAQNCVRPRAEARLGVGATDERAWQDPEYGAALDQYSAVRKLREHSEAVRDQLTGRAAGGAAEHEPEAER